MKTDHKPQIIKLLEEIRARDFANNDVWKVRAYDKVIRQLKSRDTPIYNIEDVQNISGIGEKIKKKIEEIIETGDLEQVHSINEEVIIINDLTRVFGIGPIRAKELYKEHHITNVEDLINHKELLNDKQIMGLKYYKDFEKRIPRSEMDKHKEFVRNIIEKVNDKIMIEVMGSYRRGAKTSGDIDILITHKDDPENYGDIFSKIIDELIKTGYLTDTFAKGTKKYNGVCKLKKHRTHRRIDLMYSRTKEFPFALLYFTGSQDFNVKLRSHALEMGLSLSEYGLKYTKGDNKGQHVEEEFKTEEDVLKYLGFKYIAPEKRESVVLSDYERD
jgi:DNA polymerase beta